MKPQQILSLNAQAGACLAGVDLCAETKSMSGNAFVSMRSRCAALMSSSWLGMVYIPGFVSHQLTKGAGT